MKANERVRQIEDELVRAHRQRPEIEAGAYWDRRVMSEIHERGVLGCENPESAIIQRFVWRIASTTCMLTLLLSLYAFSTGISPEKLLGNILLQDPLDSSLIRVLAL